MFCSGWISFISLFPLFNNLCSSTPRVTEERRERRERWERRERMERKERRWRGGREKRGGKRRRKRKGRREKVGQRENDAGQKEANNKERIKCIMRNEQVNEKEEQS